MQKPLVYVFLIVITIQSLSGLAATDDLTLVDDFEIYFERQYEQASFLITTAYDGNNKMIQEALNDAKLTAKIYGIALYLVRERAEYWDSEHKRLYNILKRHCEKQIAAHTSYIARQKGWSNGDRQAHEFLAIREFNNIVAGSDAQRRRFSAHIRKAPNLLGRHAAGNQPGGISLVGPYNGGRARIELVGGKFKGYEKSQAGPQRLVEPLSAQHQAGGQPTGLNQSLEWQDSRQSTHLESLHRCL
jgi:hypothetical protein